MGRTHEHQEDLKRLFKLTTPMIWEPKKIVSVLDRALGLLSHEDLLLVIQEAERQAKRD